MKHTSPQNIIISHVYSNGNKGDAALTSVLIKDLKRKYPHAAITILKLEAVTRGKGFEGIPETQSFMHFALHKYHNPGPKLLYAIFMMCATLLWAICHRWAGIHCYLPAQLRNTAQLYAHADLIVAVGGGYIRSRRGIVNRMNIPLLLHPLLFGHILGKPTVLYSQSIGPFCNTFEEWLAAAVLKRMDLILLREDTSVKLLARLGVSKNCRRAVDGGFLLQTPITVDVRRMYDIPPTSLLLGVTVRSWLADAPQANYEKAVASALDNIIEAFGAHVIFIPQVTAANGDDDRIVSRRVRNLMQHPHNTRLINGSPSHHRIKAIYDNLDVLLGTRFHSVIFSLTSFVPVVAIEYEHKTSGIMHDLHLDEWVVRIEDATAPLLTNMLHRLMQERVKYRMHLCLHLPAYIRQARRAADLLAKSYAAFRQ